MSFQEGSVHRVIHSVGKSGHESSKPGTTQRFAKIVIMVASSRSTDEMGAATSAPRWQIGKKSLSLEYQAEILKSASSVIPLRGEQ